MDLTKLTTEEIKSLKSECINELKSRKESKIDESLTVFNKKDNISTSERTHRLYEKTDYSEIGFLQKSMFSYAGNNLLGSLSEYELLIYNSQYKSILESHIIRDNLAYLSTICYDRYKNINGLEDAINNVKKLSYLEEFFKNNRNIYSYQGSFNTFLYVTNRLNNILTDANINDYEIINRNWEEKKNYIEKHLSEIARFLLDYRESVEGARLSVGNQGLLRTSKKVSENLTLNQMILSDAINFGTTLEKLESKDYSDSLGLIYIPVKKTSKIN